MRDFKWIGQRGADGRCRVFFSRHVKQGEEVKVSVAECESRGNIGWGPDARPEWRFALARVLVDPWLGHELRQAAASWVSETMLGQLGADEWELNGPKFVRDLLILVAAMYLEVVGPRCKVPGLVGEDRDEEVPF